ncbi:MAG: hypothetical protein ACLU4N_15875 [Butyricimonas faecihominis]
MLDKSEQSNKRITVLSKKKSMQEEEAFPAALLFMIHKNTPAEELHDTIRLRDIMFSTSLVRLLVHTILQHHDLALSSFGTNKHLFVPELQKNGWDLLLLETSTLSRIAGNSGRIRKKLGITPLISRIKVIPEWEKRWSYCFPRKGKTVGTKSTFANRLSYRSQISPRTTDVTTIQRWNHMERGKEYRFKNDIVIGVSQDMSEVDEKSPDS